MKVVEDSREKLIAAMKNLIVTHECGDRDIDIENMCRKEAIEDCIRIVEGDREFKEFVLNVDKVVKGMGEGYEAVWHDDKATIRNAEGRPVAALKFFRD